MKLSDGTTEMTPKMMDITSYNKISYFYKFWLSLALRKVLFYRQ